MVALQFISYGIIQGCIYALLGLGFALIYRTTRVFNIAQGATYTISAYIFFTFYNMIHLPGYICLILAVVSGIIFVVITEVSIFYPLSKRETPPSISFVASLGIYIFMINLIALIYGNEIKILRVGAEKTASFGGIILSRIQMAQIITFLIVLPLFFIYIKKSKNGIDIRALIDNPKLCQILGINVKKVRIIACSIGSVLICISSSLVALDIGIDPQTGIDAIMNGAVAMIIGGSASFIGTAIGGLLLGIIQSLAVYQISSKWQSAITFALLIIFLVFRPEGIFGGKRRVEE